MKMRFYVETSVWNFLLTEDAPEKTLATQRFFEEVLQGKHEIFISDVVLAEIDDAPETRRTALNALISKYQPVLLERRADVFELVDAYVERGVLSGKHVNDLRHLAYATVSGMNALLSWNMHHLVKLKTQNLGNATNLSLGFHSIEIRTPQEVIEDEDE